MAAAETAEASPAVTETPVRRGRRPSPRIAQWIRTWYFFRRNTLAMLGLIVLLLMLALAIYAFAYPAPYDGLTQLCATNGGTNPAPGCLCTYPVGTAPPGPNCYQTPADFPSVIAPTFTLSPLAGGPLPLGSLTVTPGTPYFFNLYAGMVRGVDWTLMISVGIVITGALAGLLIGAVAGYYGGWVDETLMRLVDIFLSVPQILLVIIMVAVLANLPEFTSFVARIELLILAFVITWWPFYARIVRGQVLVTREQKYVEAAQANGASRARIIVRHIIPNSVYPVLVQMSLDVGTIPLLIGALVFLGFHLFPTPYFPEWGSLAALSVTNLTAFLTTCQLPSGCIIPWWQFFFPGFGVFMYAISVNFLSDGLRDALDPRLRR